jgi:hypothetical protein
MALARADSAGALFSGPIVVLADKDKEEMDDVVSASARSDVTCGTYFAGACAKHRSTADCASHKSVVHIMVLCTEAVWSGVLLCDVHMHRSTAAVIRSTSPLSEMAIGQLHVSSMSMVLMLLLCHTYRC